MRIHNRSPEDFGQQILKRSPGQRFPLAGQWELTCRCNLKCVMCYTDCHNAPERIRQELSTPEIIRILDQLREAGCLELTLTGGEPLSRPDFLEIYDAAHRRGFLLTVFTNGTLITEAIADHWAEARPLKIEISLHGVSAAIFEGVTQVPGSLSRCLRAIGMLITRKIPVVLKTVGMTLNKEEILAVKRYADGLGPGVSYKFGPYLRDDLAQSGSPYDFQLSEEELENIEKQDPQLWENKCRDVTASESAVSSCGGGQQTFHIDAYGQLQLCSNNRRASYDLRKGSFKEGFYQVLPAFPCPRRAVVTSPSSGEAAPQGRVRVL